MFICINRVRYLQLRDSRCCSYLLLLLLLLLSIPGATPIARSDAESYALGYDACVAEVMRCLRARQVDDGVDSPVQPAVVTGLLDHLAKRRCGILVTSDDRRRDADHSAAGCDVGGVPNTHRLQALPVATRYGVLQFIHCR